MSRPGIEPATRRLGLALSELPGVRLGLLFGSRARGGARETSDFDIGVLVDEHLVHDDPGKTIRRLAARLGREVSSALLDIVLLNHAPPLLRHRILRDGIVLFERTEGERVRFSIKTIRDYQDGSVRREEFTKRRINKLKAKTNDGRPRDLLEKARGVARLLGKAQSIS